MEGSETKAKKSKKGLLAAIAGFIIVAGGAVATVLIVNAQNSPENVTLDAITKTLKSPTHTMTGKMEVATSTISAADSNVTYKGSIVLELEGSNNNIANTSSATVTVKTGSTSDFVFRFDEVFSEDGTLYLKGSDLSDFINSVISTFSDYLKSEPLASITNKVKVLIKKIGANWWRVSIDDVLEILGSDSQDLANQYHCVIDAAKNLFSDSSLDTLSNIYKDHQFINAKKYDGSITSFTGTAYEASVDTAKLTEFWNAYITSEPMTKISSCDPEDSQARSVFNETSEEQLSAAKDKKVYLDIDNGHNLVGFYTSGSENGGTYKVDMRLKDGADTISAPSDAKPITDLKNDVASLVAAITSLFTAATETTE